MLIKKQIANITRNDMPFGTKLRNTKQASSTDLELTTMMVIVCHELFLNEPVPVFKIFAASSVWSPEHDHMCMSRMYYEI